MDVEVAARVEGENDKKTDKNIYQTTTPITTSSISTQKSNPSENRKGIDQRSLRPCGICKKENALYKCPRCTFRTCSLDCCNKHKTLGEGCNGKRDRTSFCRVRQFTDTQLRSDYHFLEDALTATESTKRLAKSIGAMLSHSVTKKPRHDNNVEATQNPLLIQPLLNLSIQNDHENNNTGATSSFPNASAQPTEYLQRYSVALRKLVHRASDRGIQLLLMPSGMERRKRNTTKYQDKSDVIAWKVEWIFHHSPNTSTTIIQDRILENSTLEEELAKHLKSKTSNQKSYAGTILPLKSPFRAITPNKQCILLKKLPCSSKNTSYFTLDPTMTLGQALATKTIIEFPTLEVVLPEDQTCFPRMIEEVLDEEPKVES